MDFRGLGLNTGVENEIFWSATEGQDLKKPGGTPPPIPNTPGPFTQFYLTKAVTMCV